VRTGRAGQFDHRALTVLRRVFDDVAVKLEGQLSGLERVFRQPAGLETVDEAALAAVPDAADRPILRTAIAARAPYLLSLDRRHFPHGAVYGGVQCWHPDAFLTLFFHQNPRAFERAVQGLATSPEAVRRRLLP
jgi:hypothetical protein